MLEDANGTNCQSSNFCRTVGVLAQSMCLLPIVWTSAQTFEDANAIELIDFGRENSEVDYAQKIQIFHRFLIDHLSSEGNFFPHNPILLRQNGANAGDHNLAPAPITQLIGVDAKNVIVCSSCKAVRVKENMTHVVDLIYSRKVNARECVFLAKS